MRVSVLTAVLIWLAVGCSSCVSYRYFPLHQSYYNFDSAHDYRIGLGLECVPFTLGSITGANLDVAYSPLAHVAVCGEAYARMSTGQSRERRSFLDDHLLFSLSSNSYAIGGGCGIGYYSMVGPNTGADVFVRYDYQRIRYHFNLWQDEPSGNYAFDFNKPLHTASVQPSVYQKVGADTWLDFGIGLMAVASDTPHYFRNAPRVGPYAADVLVQPGLAFNFPFASLGFNVSESPFHPDRVLVGHVDAISPSIYTHYQGLYNVTFRVVLSNEAFHSFTRRPKKLKPSNGSGE